MASFLNVYQFHNIFNFDFLGQNDLKFKIYTRRGIYCFPISDLYSCLYKLKNSNKTLKKERKRKDKTP